MQVSGSKHMDDFLGLGGKLDDSIPLQYLRGSELFLVKALCL